MPLNLVGRDGDEGEEEQRHAEEASEEAAQELLL